MTVDIQQSLKSLRLGGMANTLQKRHQEAKANELDYIDFLELLIDDEITRRRDNLLNRRMKLAKFPFLRTIDEFDFSFNPGINKKEIMSLLNCNFVHKSNNVLLIGPPGVGKSHIAISLGIAAIHNGYKVLYKSAFDLVQDMDEAASEDRRKQYISQLLTADLLIIDELGMKKMPTNTADDLMEIIHRRYQNTSTLIATNRPLEDWGKILGDNVATSAILDRFLDNATIFNMKGKSYRMKNKSKNTKK